MHAPERQAEHGIVVDARAHAGCRFNPHDLLWADDAGSYTSGDTLPGWASNEWSGKAPAVVRRERVADPDNIPVGLRGATREQRHKAYVQREHVSRHVTPDMLAQAPVLDTAWRLGRFAAIETLLKIAPVLNGLPLVWGPTGSVGFALASGIAVLRPASDLDLLVRASRVLDTETVKALRALPAITSCRLDIQIDTGRGAFSFAEWAQGGQRVMLKTDDGPVLTGAPWDERTSTAGEAS